MFKNYFKTAWRNLIKNKGYSAINIGGLAVGMAVAMFIGLWIYDELSFNKYHKNYDNIAQVWGGGINSETSMIEGSYSMQYPVGLTLQNNYSQYFKHILMAWGVGNYSLSFENEKFNKKGEFIEGDVIDMLSLKMLKGTYKSLEKPHSVILSESTSKAIFGNEDPMNKILRIDNRMDAEVTGIYEDVPKNNRFSEVQFFSTWALFVSANDWIIERENDWDNRPPFNIYVQLQPNTTAQEVNARIKDVYYKNVPADFFKTIEKSKPFVQLIPMSTWHLYAEFENGEPTRGRITFVWLFGVIGVFVLLLACINFTNLSTARSEKRAKEVGVRKVMGSDRGQLISQFLSESFMMVMLSFTVAIMLLGLFRSWFNEVADKDIALPFTNPLFWIMSIAFIVFTGFAAGIYPAFYLSSFRPVKVLKGVSGSGRLATLPRRVLVVIQFTVSMVLIIGTLVVYQQIQFAKNRPVGYDRGGLITVEMNDPDYKSKQDVLKTELLRTGYISSIASSSSPVTAVWNVTSGYAWQDKMNLKAEFAKCNVTPDFGKTVGWKIVEGRDFSRDFPTDSSKAIIINEAAVKYMGLKDPIGKEITDVDEFGKPKWTKRIIGVVKNMVMESPYEPVKQTLYYFNKDASNLLHLKTKAKVSAGAALPKIKAVFDKISPAVLFDYKFVNEEYAAKFSQEERIGKLSGIFAILAIFISCLGLFGLASFVAEQRTKEIGIRKVVGASVFSLWRLLSKDFVMMVLIALFIAIPVAYYFMYNWLQNYQYRTNLSWWIFAVAGIGALLITLLTVSFQAIKAAIANPVKSLRTE